jgi:hypothetical protein
VVIRSAVAGSVVVEVDILPSANLTFRESEDKRLLDIVQSGTMDLLGGALYVLLTLIPSEKGANKQQETVIESITVLVMGLMGLIILVFALVLYARQKGWICKSAVQQDEEGSIPYSWVLRRACNRDDNMLSPLMEAVKQISSFNDFDDFKEELCNQIGTKSIRKRYGVYLTFKVSMNVVGCMSLRSLEVVAYVINVLDWLSCT